jgi:hypothetical protein
MEAKHADFAREFFRLLQRDAAQRVGRPRNGDEALTAWTTATSDVVLVLADLGIRLVRIETKLGTLPKDDFSDDK